MRDPLPIPPMQNIIIRTPSDRLRGAALISAVASLVIFGGVLPACTTTGPGSTTPAQIVFATKGAYATALTGAVAYESMPRCAPAVPKPCSDPELVAQIRKADNVAAAALDAAEAAVRTPAVGTTARDRAIQAAQAALAAFSALVTSLGAPS